MISACEFCSIVESNIAREKAEERERKYKEEEARKERERLIAEKRKNTLIFCEDVLAPSFDKQINEYLTRKSVFLPNLIVIDKEDKDNFVSVSNIEEKDIPIGKTKFGNTLYTRKITLSSEIYSISVLKDYFKERGYKVNLYPKDIITHWSDATKKIRWMPGTRIEIFIDCDLA